MNKHYTKLQNICAKLNQDGAMVKKNWSGAKRNPQFTPCAKSLVFISHMRKDTPLPEIMVEAYNTPCNCHGGFQAESFFEFQDKMNDFADLHLYK